MEVNVNEWSQRENKEAYKRLERVGEGEKVNK